MWCNVGSAECIEGDCANGQGTVTLPNGDKYVGEYKNDKRHGQGTFTGNDGTVMRGVWENDKLVEPN